MGGGFDVETREAEPPHLTALRVVEATVAYDGCVESGFSLHSAERNDTNGVKAVFLRREIPLEEGCKVDPKTNKGYCSLVPHRLSHIVRIPLPEEALGDFQMLLFAFPPNQQYE